MGFLFGGGKKSQSSSVQKYSGLQVQTSVYGRAIPIVYGRSRVSGNLMDYTDFKSTPKSQGSAGKGGVGGGGGGKGGGGSETYTYSTTILLELSEGPTSNVHKIWWDKNQGTLSSIGFTFFNGSYAQAPWSYLTANHPDQALNYHGFCYVAAANMNLGNSAQLPNYNFELAGILAGSAPNGIDADPSQALEDFLTNANYGVGFDASWVADLSVWQNWCLANGLWISPVLDSQTNASTFIDELSRLTNSAPVWLEGGAQLTMIPYGDANVTGNGYTYTAPTAPLFDLDDRHFLPIDDKGPVQTSRKRSSDNFNTINVEYLDRAKDYNVASVQAKDQAGIDTFGLRQMETISAHMLCESAPARLAAQMILQRQAIKNRYTFKLDQRWLFLDPMDIVTITDATLGLFRQWVRIIEITQDSDTSLTILVEEYLNGTGNAAAYQTQSLDGTVTDYNEDPGPTNIPVTFEAPLKLLQSAKLEVWMALSGGAMWGGADVYTSTDGDTYAFQGRQVGPSRTGVLTALLALYARNVNGPTVDQTNTLAVDLAQSQGELITVATGDALALNTLCYVGGELLAYANADLTGSYAYDCSYLVRGAYDSEIAEHAAGTAFARLDDQIFKIPVDQSYVGKAIYIKVVPFNIYGGGQPSIDSIQAVQYLLTGGELLAPLDNPTALALSFTDKVAQLNWTGITDIRYPIFYEIRVGDTFENSQIYARTSQTHYPIAGVGTYWVSAFYLTPFGAQVYSAGPPSLEVTQASIEDNVIGSYVEDPSWPGTVSGGAQKDGPVINLTTDTIDILAQADVFALANIFGLAGIPVLVGAYTVDVSHQIFSQYIANAKVIINWLIGGAKVGESFLEQPDFLAQTDFLGEQFSSKVYAIPQIRTTQDFGMSWSEWQNWVAGVYPGNGWDFRIIIATTDPQINAILSAFSFTVDIPTVVESGTATTSGSADVAVAYERTYNTIPIPQVTIADAVAGDTIIINTPMDSGFAVSVYNGGVRVVRDINYQIGSH